MKHLRHYRDTTHVRSECEKRPPDVKYTDLTSNICEVECTGCLEERRIKAYRDAADCTDRLADMLDRIPNVDETEVIERAALAEWRDRYRTYLS